MANDSNKVRPEHVAEALDDVARRRICSRPKRRVRGTTKGAGSSAPALLTSLTGEQAAFLREAAEKRGGVYVPINRGTVASSLAEGGAATFREVSQTGGGRSASDPRPSRRRRLRVGETECLANALQNTMSLFGFREQDRTFQQDPHDPSGAAFAERHTAYAAPATHTAVTVKLSGDAARLVLRGLACNGVTVVRQARAAHGSDCSCDASHLTGSMRHCRCVRVMRLRTVRNGDWLLVFGDYQEGPAFKLSGPYAADAKLTYGGGFWASVEV